MESPTGLQGTESNLSATVEEGKRSCFAPSTEAFSPRYKQDGRQSSELRRLRNRILRSPPLPGLILDQMSLSRRGGKKKREEKKQKKSSY